MGERDSSCEDPPASGCNACLVLNSQMTKLDKLISRKVVHQKECRGLRMRPVRIKNESPQKKTVKAANCVHQSYIAKRAGRAEREPALSSRVAPNSWEPSVHAR